METFSQPLSDLHPANDKLFGPKRCLLLRVGGRGGLLYLSSAFRHCPQNQRISGIF